MPLDTINLGSVANDGTGDDARTGGSKINAAIERLNAGGPIPVTATGTSTARTLANRFAFTVHVEDMGAVGDGSTDDSEAIQAAIDLVASRGGGDVLFGPSKYALETGLTVRSSNVRLIGRGFDVRHDVGTAENETTVLLWNGTDSADNTVVDIGPTEGASAQYLVGCAVKGLAIWCEGKAGRGLHVRSVRYGDFEVSGRGAKTYLYDFGCATTLGEATDLQHCRIRLYGNQATYTGVGFHVYGAGSGNFSLNHDVQVQIRHSDADAIVLDSCDNNTFQLLRAQRTGGGTGEGIILNGAATSAVCRANTFHRVTSTAGLIARGTSSFTVASHDNIIFDYDKENGIPDPTIETGAELIWRSNTTNRWNYHDVMTAGAYRIGGTEVLKGATETWTPTVSASSGTITTATINVARFTRVGPLIFYTLGITMTDNGTGSGVLRATLPSAAAYAAAGAGYHTTSGFGLATNLSPSSDVLNIVRSSNASYPVATGEAIRVSGFYMAA